jgi:uncharacterized protein YukE
MDTREIYKEKTEATIEELNARIDLLRSQMKGKAADAKLSLNSQVELLEEKRQDLESRLRQLRSSAGDAWKEIAIGIDQALDDVGQALERAGEEFNQALS